jgi:serine/threonine-protein kinase PRP4
MFNGADNNDMLRLHILLNGLPPKKSLRKAQFVSEHFDDEFVFERSSIDPVSGQVRVWLILVDMLRRLERRCISRNRGI